MMKREYLFAILAPLIFAIGYFCGIFLHPHLAGWPEPKASVDLTRLFGNEIIDFDSGAVYTIDTLNAHDKNLLIFWSPSCQFCRNFFNNRLNQEEVGIFCFPLSDDYEYLDFFLKQHDIKYPQLVVRSDIDKHQVSAPFVEAIPTFIITDNKSNIIQKYVGTDSVDKLISTLYKN